MSSPVPFQIKIPQAKLDAIKTRVAEYQWFAQPNIGGDWQFGMSTPALKDLQAYWLDTYDWRAAETDLNHYPQYHAEIECIDIHFIHVVGEAGGKRPLLLTHGWPGSVYEFWQSIGPLAYPSQHGGKAEDAFDLIIPSLPGFGFSGKPAAPIGPRGISGLWNTLMQDVLGYKTYFAQGGDWGAAITSWLGLEHGAHDGKGGCTAIHLNMLTLRPNPAIPQSDAEIEWLQRSQTAMQAEGSYFFQHATKPQTTAMALSDSPMGSAAWIIEKFHGWSHLSDGDLLSVYTRDQLLTNLMIYLVNDAVATSLWIYTGFAMESAAGLKPNQRCETPTWFADYPGEPVYSPPPRAWVERAYNLSHWAKMTKGGHFAAMEAPDLFVEDVRAWGAKVAS